MTPLPSRISILLVEDEEIALKALAGVISRRFPKVVVHTAVNGRNGVELFKRHMPEVVITDINMPKWAVCRWLMKSVQSGRVRNS